ncbi:hypothetical protein N431DRAFT_426228 [Stipitochalara longipes BDJ]|nr:hypothetical protein N431DRAFT_426228 [Stipitochalara longipes BDJ]
MRNFNSTSLIWDFKHSTVVCGAQARDIRFALSTFQLSIISPRMLQLLTSRKRENPITPPPSQESQSHTSKSPNLGHDSFTYPTKPPFPLTPPPYFYRPSETTLSFPPFSARLT